VARNDVYGVETSEGWRTERGKLTLEQVEKHLKGEFTLGKGQSMKLIFQKIDVLGRYIPYKKAIVLNVDAPILLKIYTLLHELFHYFTDIIIDNCETWIRINKSFDHLSHILSTKRIRSGIRRCQK
jgi:hypothetical protein